MKLIIDIDSEDYDFLKDSHLSYNMDSLSKQSNKDVEGTLTLLRLVDNVKNGIPLDEKTNGEMLKIIFPNIITDELMVTMHTETKVTCCGDKHCKGAISYDFWKEWWNAPYKEK